MFGFEELLMSSSGFWTSILLANGSLLVVKSPDTFVEAQTVGAFQRERRSVTEVDKTSLETSAL